MWHVRTSHYRLMNGLLNSGWSLRQDVRSEIILRQVELSTLLIAQSCRVDQPSLSLILIGLWKVSGVTLFQMHVTTSSPAYSAAHGRGDFLLSSAARIPCFSFSWSSDVIIQSTLSVSLKAYLQTRCKYVMPPLSPVSRTHNRSSGFISEIICLRGLSSLFSQALLWVSMSYCSFGGWA